MKCAKNDAGHGMQVRGFEADNLIAACSCKLPKDGQDSCQTLHV